jgi:hypothetical protein
MGKQVSAPSQTSTQNSQMSNQQGAEWDKQIGNMQNTVAGDINSVNFGQNQSALGQMSSNILGNQVNSQQLAAPISAAGQASWNQPGVASSYMSPYESTAMQSQIGQDTASLLNPQLAGMQRSDAASGALGGSRGAIQQNQATDQFNKNEMNQISQGANTAYNTGQQAFQADANRNLQGQTSAANTQLAGNASNIYANLGAQQPLMNQLQMSEAPAQQEMQAASVLAMQPREGTVQNTNVQSPGSTGGIGNATAVIGGAAQGVASYFGMAQGGIVGSGKRPSANVGIPFESYEAGMSKGGIMAGRKSKKSKKSKGKK